VSQNPDDRRRRPFLLIILAAILALGISFLGAYLVVLSQNPASAVSGPSFVYGSPSP
jgi:hypothetical protein